MFIRTAKDIASELNFVSGFKQRDCLKQIVTYLCDSDYHNVLCLSGLRRTGKTTLMEQAINALPENDRDKAFFIIVRSDDLTWQVVDAIKVMKDKGFHYAFIDEATRAEDFMKNASLYADGSARLDHMKVVLSGTDSFSFIRTAQHELYDRARSVRTTYMSYREWKRLSTKSGLDAYLRYGGIFDKTWMPHANDEKNEGFSDADAAGRYVATAIAKNIQNTLRHENYEDSFGALRDLFRADELVSAIQRIIQDNNHNFGLDVLASVFKSRDFSFARDSLAYAKNFERRSMLLKKLNAKPIIERLRRDLHIINPEEAKIPLTKVHTTEIEEFLKALDVIVEVPVKAITDIPYLQPKRLSSQPGMRYAQAFALLEALSESPAFIHAENHDKDLSKERVMSAAVGAMLEDAILLDTMRASDGFQVFKYRLDTQYIAGVEYDMILRDPDTKKCVVIEIKHSNARNEKQLRAFRHTAFNEQFENTIGKIERKIVLYGGEPYCTEDGIYYINYEDWLTSLDNGVRYSLDYTIKKIEEPYEHTIPLP